MAETKNKKYVSDNARLMSEWDWGKNDELGLVPNKLFLGSNKRAHWICVLCGNHWSSIIANRSRGCNCPVCARNRIGNDIVKAAIKRSGTLAEKYPSIATEWGDQNSLSPNDVSPGSNKTFWWNCSNGHSYKSTVANRVQGRGCPICAGKIILKGYNDLFTIYPLAKEMWNYSRNIDVYPEKYASKSHKVVWWKCSRGHEWKSKISHFTTGHSCPYCAGQRAVPGVNDIKTINPKLAEEWDYGKNIVPIETIMQSSGKKFWWKCQYGHSWQASVAHRNTGEGCPICASSLRTSFPEKAILYYIKKSAPDAIGSYRDKVIAPYELDVFVPSRKIAIEYDGEFYHQDTSRDLVKDKICRKIGIRLFRIREPNCPLYQTSACFILLHSLSISSLEQAIIELFNLIGFDARSGFIDIDRDRSIIEELRVHSSITNSFGDLFPNLISEWNTERNGGITPYSVTKSSGRKVWWKCKTCGYEWESIVANRSKGSGCPACAKANASKRAFIREQKKKKAKEEKPFSYK